MRDTSTFFSYNELGIVDESNAITFAVKFSSYDYYTNYNFNRCMKNYNIYLESENESDEVLAEWEEVCIKDFLDEARIWLDNNHDMIHWKVGLE